MKKICVLSLLFFLTAIAGFSFTDKTDKELYISGYMGRLNQFKLAESALLNLIGNSDIGIENDLEKIRTKINDVRVSLKKMDFWLRYFEPTVYKKINGPLAVEWETEVFEKFEKPYKREGAGLTLAALYTEEKDCKKDSLLQLVRSSVEATETFAADSITGNLNTYHHFYLCNRLFLLNLSSIYTTGFECPDTSRIIPELHSMLVSASDIYTSFNKSFPEKKLNDEYLLIYNKAIAFVNEQPGNFSQFDHFSFIRNYVNPLFSLNQEAIRQHRVYSKSFVDYSLAKTATSIFDKRLYNGLNPKGIFIRVEDEKALQEINKVGKLLFYDPILSGNNKRSCGSCHKTTDFFTDTISVAALQFNRKDLLPRNTPSLINAIYNHLAMQDGVHISLQNQARAVITNPGELACSEKEVMQKVLGCPDYKKAFTKLLKFTPEQTDITFDHIVSAITFYYSRFSKYYAPFDEAMNGNGNMSERAKKGFNLFMSKAQCATCHFVPQFNGVKPPFIGSEFEVLGVPSDTAFKHLSNDKGRYNVNPAEETLNAFRTGSLRNSMHTAPYMHNGVFKSMNEVIDFYDAGGGAGKGLKVTNQTLSSDSLHLSKEEKESLVEFLKSLNEHIVFEALPGKLPLSKNKDLNRRKVGGEY